MSRNVYTKTLIKGFPLENNDSYKIFNRDYTRIALWSLQELIRLYPDYKIIKDRYIAFAGTDILIHIDNYTYFYNQQLRSRYHSLLVNPLNIENNGTRLIRVKMDNGSLQDHRVHYIYEWMIKVVITRSVIITQYELKEDIPNLPIVDFNTKDLTPMSFKKLKEGMVWM